MVVPFAAGGPVDVLGRILAQYLGEAHRQAGDRRQCAWRRRHDRLAAGLPGSARWLQFVLGIDRHPCAQSDAVQEAAVQRRHRFRPGRADRRCRAGAHDAQGFAGQQPCGIHRLRQGEPGQDAVRLGRGRHLVAYRLRAAQPDDRHRHHPRSLSRRRAGHGRPVRRPRRLCLQHRLDRGPGARRQSK